MSWGELWKNGGGCRPAHTFSTTGCHPRQAAEVLKTCVEAMPNRLVAGCVMLGVLLSAQATWTVNAVGRPGVPFVGLLSALQAANDGDTIAGSVLSGAAIGEDLQFGQLCVFGSH